jgi:glycosyltransferase involved in cell wall biosynthesis
LVKLSIIVAVYNEKENIRPLIESIRKALAKGTMEYEIIFVHDVSHDGTPGMIREYISRDVTLSELKKNFGQTAALKAGIDHASGEYIATVDGDLQNDPEDLPMMVEVLTQND